MVETEERKGYYNLNDYIHITSDEDEFIIDKEDGIVYVVIPDINHGCKEEIELKTHHDELAEIFGVKRKITLNQLLDEFNLGGVL